jgi:hypothetical protein
LARYHGGDASATGPVNSARPAISGLAAEGQTLTVMPGAWSGASPISVTHRWQRCDSTGALAACQLIAGATALSYTVGVADVGHTIRVRETATNAYGQSSADSAATAVVTATAGTIAGSVRSARTGSPIAGANVNCGNGATATTASDGRYSIPNVVPGSYACVAAAAKHVPSTQTTTVTSRQTTTVNFTLLKR